MNENQYFERSRRVVRFIRLEDGGELRSAMGTLEPSCVENFSCFLSQLTDGEFLVLERRGVDLFRILSIVKKGSVLHEVYDIAFSFDLEFGFRKRSKPRWRVTLRNRWIFRIATILPTFRL